MIQVGVDDGYRETKLAWRENGILRTLRVPSLVRVGALGVTDLDGTLSGYETEGETYSVGDFREGEETRFADYPLSPLVRVLVHHALVLAGFSGKDVGIATGLPPRDAFLPDGRKNAELIARKIERFSLSIQLRGGGDPARVREHRVYTQGIGALIDFLFDGETLRELSGPVGVVDIGGRTTDVAVVLPGPGGLTIDHARSGSENVGVLDILDDLSRLIRTKERIDDIPLSALERALTTGTIRLWGRDREVADLVTLAKARTSERVSRVVSVFLGEAADLETILFAGGGALALPDLLKRYPHAVTVPDPQFANARGFLKSLLVSES